ncbi:hypothetical protein AMECASPLE_039630 [Ameca splendens]|uniref:Uncharacterized protein n=1 Tax=Ameca splendens TaxID=208324 RepID=A0ABV0YKM6_9TELE
MSCGDRFSFHLDQLQLLWLGTSTIFMVLLPLFFLQKLLQISETKTERKEGRGTGLIVHDMKPQMQSYPYQCTSVTACKAGSANAGLSPECIRNEVMSAHI